jgi:hypothetical protein
MAYTLRHVLGRYREFAEKQPHGAIPRVFPGNRSGQRHVSQNFSDGGGVDHFRPWVSFVRPDAGRRRRAKARYLPEYTPSGDLILPKDYHSWVYVGSPLTP